MSSIETWVVPTELLALIDRNAIEEADAELAAAEETLRRAVDAHDKARAAAIAACAEWDELRRRSRAGAVVSSEEISRVHRAQSDGAIVAAFRSDAGLAAKAALEPMPSWPRKASGCVSSRAAHVTWPLRFPAPTPPIRQRLNAAGLD